MKKTLLIIALAVFCAQAVSAQRVGRPRKAYNNFSYVAEQKISDPATGALLGEADWGAAFTKGRTYNLHRPIAGFLVFGIDATWLDLNYASYGTSLLGNKLHQADISMGVGPSINLYPVSKLGIHGYFRYNPTFATCISEDFSALMGGYSSVFVSGGAISFGAISVGAEARWGEGKYKDFGGNFWDKAIEDVVDDLPIDVPDGALDDLPGLDRKSTTKLKTSGIRVFLSLRF